MGTQQESRFERLELKYLIDEQTATAIRHEILPYCSPDRHNSPIHGGYMINTLYLDTPNLAFYHAKMRDEPDRVKLRVRAYDSDGPLHFEIKRKCRDVVEKTRAIVARDRCDAASRGSAGPLGRDRRSRSYLERFVYLRTMTGAAPISLIRYHREAYQSHIDRYARVTFDRQVAAQPVRGWDFDGEDERWCSLAGSWMRGGHHSPVLLELKCETVMPSWMSVLIQRHELKRQGFSKYCRGVDVTAGAQRGMDATPGPRGVYV